MTGGKAPSRRRDPADAGRSGLGDGAGLTFEADRFAQERQRPADADAAPYDRAKSGIKNGASRSRMKLRTSLI